MKKYLLHLSACAFAVALAACGGGNDAAEDKASAAPAITTQPASLTTTATLAATFKVVATGGGLSYQWYKAGATGDTLLSGVTAAEFSFNTVQESDSGDYYVVVSNKLNGSTSSVTSAKATLTVNSPPVISAYPVARTVTAGSPATFSVTATADGALTYQWFVYKPDAAGVPATTPTAIEGATSATYTIASAQKTDATTYFVTVTNGAGGLAISTPGVKLTVN